MSQQLSDSTSDIGTGKSVDSAHGAGRTKRGWLRFFVRLYFLIIVLAAALVVAAPTIVSMRPVTQFALGYVNGAIRGEVAVDSVALSWTKPTVLKDARVLDSDRREVLVVPQVTLSRSVWAMVREAWSFGELHIDDPVLQVYVDADQTVSIVEAFETVGDGTSDGGIEVGSGDIGIHPVGRVVVRGGAATIERDGSAPVMVTGIQTDVALNGLEQVVGELALTPPDSGALKGGFKVANLVRDGVVDAASADVEVDLRSERPVDLLTVSKVLQDLGVVDESVMAGGTATFAIDGSMHGGESSLTYKLGLANVRTVHEAAPLNLSIKGDGQFDGETWRVQLNAVDEAGTGNAKVALDGVLRDGDVLLNYDVALADVRAVDGATPLNLQVKGKGQYDGQTIQAEAAIGGAPGNVTALLMAEVPEALPALDVEQVLNALVAGESLSLPALTLTVDGVLDLPAMVSALPGVLPLNKDLHLDSGRLELSDVAVRGGATPSVAGRLHLTDVSAVGGGRTLKPEPVTLDVAAKLETGRGVVVDRADVRAAFASVEASGTVEDMSCTFDVDAGQMLSELTQVVDVGEMELSGRVSGAATLNRIDEQSISTDVRADLANVRFSSGDGPVYAVDSGSIHEIGRVTLRDDRVASIEATSLSVDVDQRFFAAGSGDYDVASGAMSARIGDARVDLAHAASRLKPLLGDVLDRFGGAVGGSFSVARSSADAPMTTSGQLRGNRLTVEGRPFADGPVTLAWSDLVLDEARLQVARVDVSADETTFQGEDVRVDIQDATITKAKVAVETDLRGLEQKLKRITGEDVLGSVEGRTTMDATIVQHDGSYLINGTGQFANLAFRAGDQDIRERSVDVAFNANIDPAGKTITLGSNRVTSDSLTAIVTGDVAKFDTVPVLNLRGRYDLSWGAVMDLLRQIDPKIGRTLDVEGRSASMFAVKGVAHRDSAVPPFRDLSGQVGVGWQAAKVAGVDVESQEIEAAFRDGQLTIPTTTIATSRGRVAVGGTLDFTQAVPMLRIPGSLPLLRDVAVTPELSRELISRINPVFYQIGAADGLVNLSIKDVAMPLDATQSARGRGTGQLELVETRLMPAGLMMELLSLSGLAGGKWIGCRLEGADFTIREDRIHYRNFGMIFADQVDVRFYGSVGFDDTLDLVVSLPVHEKLLGKLGVRARLEGYAAVLKGLRVDIPLAGTRKKPKLNLAAVDTQKLLDRVLRDAVGNTVEDLVEDLIKKNTGRKDGRKTKPSRRKQPTNDASRKRAGKKQPR